MSKVKTVVSAMVMALIVTGTVVAGEVRLAAKGEARCVIVVAPGSLAGEGDAKIRSLAERKERQLLFRESVADLAIYLGKMSGAKFEVVEGLPAGDKRTPIYIGAEAQKVFGPVGKTMAGKFAFRVVAGRKGVGLYGESEYGTSYAIYELLGRLGCRWYMPSEMGECIPQAATLELPELDVALAPATEYRGMWDDTADHDFLRRNRMNGNLLASNQLGLENCISKEQLAAHPEWQLQVNGKPSGYLKWTRQDIADAVADTIIQRLDKDYTPTVSLTPGDYVVPTDDPEEVLADPVPRVWEPAANKWSITDRLVLLANRVAEKVGKKYPDVRFGVLMYVNYSMPPMKYKVHPNVIPVISPIDFNRQHPMTWPNHPNQTWLLDMVKGWGKISPRMGYYYYGMNLAELSAPNPFITKWGTDIPIIMSNHCTYWMPETKGGWASMLPGYQLGIRLTFDPTLKPDAVIQEMMERFYGPAAEPMSRYWHVMDRAWVDANEYSGSAFGYLRMFTPEVMKQARAAVDEALSKCRTIPEYQRVQLVNESQTLFELFMKMRRDWAAGRLEGLGKDMDQWRGSLNDMSRRYKAQFAIHWITQEYVDSQFGIAYSNASQVAKSMSPLAPALVKWKYCYDKDKNAETLGWTKPEFDDAAWKTTHVVEETWSTLGHHNTMGRMAYRVNVNLASVPAGKKVFLWIGSNDGTAKVFVNGQHVKYNEKGELKDVFNGYCQPAMFDVTAVVKAGANQLTILCERQWLNELGTGGLMGPVVMFRDK
ncbi:MAG: DUF4838 domain-containing protein [bacterium]